MVYRFPVLLHVLRTLQDDETAPIEMTDASSLPTAGTVTLTKKSKD
eukprot:SAG22_NODE_16635_length_321_cov_0.680180_1_plen_45_part_01